jgi:hypothetical protein
MNKLKRYAGVVIDAVTGKRVDTTPAVGRKSTGALALLLAVACVLIAPMARATDPTTLLPALISTFPTELTTLVGALLVIGLTVLGWRIGKRVVKAMAP